ncbi:MAG: carbohydrate ABC transporter permease [Propionibacteriaceae bacterium]|jgi:raffinose/stachyose/melibiose transport system permease protein|nr:carbohydrate ABC transporter permease [Propionibacteriaceae bacterium]
MTAETGALEASGPAQAKARRRPGGLGRRLRRLPLGIATAVLLVVEVYPLVWLLLGSLKTQPEFMNNPTWALPEDWTNFSNYRQAWESGISRNLLNSVVAVFPSLAIVIVFGVAAGFALEVMVWKGRGTVLLVFLAGIMIPAQMILLPLFNVYFRTHLTGTVWPLILTYTATGLPLTVFMMATYFRAIPRELFEAATIDGASMLTSFRLIAFPMMANAIFTVGLVQFFFLWNDLLFAMTFTSGSGHDELATVQVGLLNFRGRFGTVQYGPTMAAICVNALITVFIYLFLNQRVMKGMAAGAVKG